MFYRSVKASNRAKVSCQRVFFRRRAGATLEPREHPPSTPHKVFGYPSKVTTGEENLVASGGRWTPRLEQGSGNGSGQEAKSSGDTVFYCGLSRAAVDQAGQCYVRCQTDHAQQCGSRGEMGGAPARILCAYRCWVFGRSKLPGRAAEGGRGTKRQTNIVHQDGVRSI